MNGKKVKSILMQKGISLTELADKLGMKKQNLSSILSGEDLKSGFLEKTAEAIGVPVCSFYNGEHAVAVNNSGSIGDNSANISSDEGLRVLESQLGVKDKQLEEKDVQIANRDRNVKDLIEIIKGMNK